MRRVFFAIPGDLMTPTGGYAYDRRIIAELEKLGWNTEILHLGEGFPTPSREARKIALERLAGVPAQYPIVIDGLAFGALPELAKGFCSEHRVIALVHHPLALETGLSPAEAETLRTSERAALAGARRVVVTSAAIRRILASDYGLPSDRITIVPPGSDGVAKAHGGGDGPPILLAVGAIVPRKGYDVLIAALASLSDLPWRLTIAGDRTRDTQTAVQLDSDIVRFRLSERVNVTGTVSAERLAELYAGADMFVLASRFEGYGMAFAEAIAHGLPVVATTSGALADTIPCGTGIFVPPDDIGKLAAALRRLIEDRSERDRLARAARAAAQHLPTWEDSAKLMVQAIEAAL